MKIAGFDWDEGNREKCQKHGVTIAEIEGLFAGELLVAPDMAHSASEERWIAVGRGWAKRAMFVAFTLRELDERTFVRPVSARFMHKKEADRYDQIANEGSAS